MSVRLIDFNCLAVYEAGALLVTLLAFPDASDETQGNVHASLCNYALKVRSAIEPDWTIVPRPIKPFYAFRSERDCNRDLRTLVRRWRDRMVAGRMGIAFLKEAGAHGVEHHSFTGVRMGAPLPFSSTTTNLAGS